MRLNQQKAERAQEIARHPWKNAEKALAHQRPDGVIGEWKNVLPHKQNRFQKVADWSHGLLTVGNLVTVAGAAATANGLRHYHRGEYVKATLWMFGGRFGGDLGDGAAAAITETRGAPGALMDATADKLLAASFVAVAVDKGDVTLAEAVVHGLQQARSARENARLKLSGGEPNPSRFGKWGQALLWLEAGGIVLGHACDEYGAPQQIGETLSFATNGVKFGAIILNERAADEYEDRRLSFEASQSS